jgi:hypothetical protein
MGQQERMTFIVRLSRDERGRVSGIVERVRTGKKEQFHEVEALGVLIARMVEEAERAGGTSCDNATPPDDLKMVEDERARA